MNHKPTAETWHLYRTETLPNIRLVCAAVESNPEILRDAKCVQDIAAALNATAAAKAIFQKAPPDLQIELGQLIVRLLTAIGVNAAPNRLDTAQRQRSVTAGR